MKMGVRMEREFTKAACALLSPTVCDDSRAGHLSTAGFCWQQKMVFVLECRLTVNVSVSVSVAMTGRVIGCSGHVAWCWLLRGCCVVLVDGNG